MKFFLGVLIFFIQVVFVAQAQRVCGTTDYMQQLLTADPAIKNAYNIAEAQIAAVTKKGLNLAARDTTANEIIYIPCLLYTSDAADE